MAMSEIDELSQQQFEETLPQTSKSSAEYEDEICQMRTAYDARLILARMQTEAVRAGIIDLDGLRLADLSRVTLRPDDKLIGAKEAMESLRRAKPWLFGAALSSSSSSVAPPSQPARPRSALEMTDEEYIAARTALVNRRL
jgi:hypothetical protein